MFLCTQLSPQLRVDPSQRVSASEALSFPIFDVGKSGDGCIAAERATLSDLTCRDFTQQVLECREDVEEGEVLSVSFIYMIAFLFSFPITNTFKITALQDSDQFSGESVGR